MQSTYLGILFLLLVGGGLLALLILLSILLGPQNPTRTKQLPFECGATAVGDLKSMRFGVHFYPIAVLFLLFDIEVLFLYPWSTTLRETGWNGFTGMLIFLLVIGLGLAYTWRKGELDWNRP